MALQHIESFSVTVTIGGSETTIKGHATGGRYQDALTEAQIKEKINQAYKTALKATLDAKKDVTPS